MNLQVLTFGMFLAFCISLASVIYVEQRKRTYEIWESYLRKFKSHLEWLRFATDHEAKIKSIFDDKEQSKRDRQDASFEILNTVFKETKYLIGREKDTLIANLQLDIDEIKKKIKERRSNNEEICCITQHGFKPQEKIEWEVSLFCEQYSNVDIVNFVASDSWFRSIERLNNTYDSLHQYFAEKQNKLNVKTIIFTYLPMIVSLTSSFIWLLSHFLPFVTR